MKVKKADRNEWIHCINSSVKNQHNQKTAKLICIVFFWNYKHIVADIPWIIAANFHQIYSHIILHKQKLIWFRNVDSCDLKKNVFFWNEQYCFVEEYASKHISVYQIITKTEDVKFFQLLITFRANFCAYNLLVCSYILVLLFNETWAKKIVDVR